jgi:hypothetical protein
MVLDRAVPLILALTAASPAAADILYVVEDKENNACTVVIESQPAMSMVIADEACMVFAAWAETEDRGLPSTALARNASGMPTGKTKPH